MKMRRERHADYAAFTIQMPMSPDTACRHARRCRYSTTPLSVAEFTMLPERYHATPSPMVYACQPPPRRLAFACLSYATPQFR